MKPNVYFKAIMESHGFSRTGCKGYCNKIMLMGFSFFLNIMYYIG